MAVCLILLGFVIGMGFFGPEGGVFGLIIAIVIWLILTAVSFSSCLLYTSPSPRDRS